MYREYGARVLVSVGYRDTANQLNVGRYACVSSFFIKAENFSESFDYNNSFGHGRKNFLKTCPQGITQQFASEWETWCSGNVTDDETEEGKGTEGSRQVVIKGGVVARKADFEFKRNSTGEPMIPEDYPKLNLETRKHIIRSFLKIHYG